MCQYLPELTYLYKRVTCNLIVIMLSFIHVLIAFLIAFVRRNVDDIQQGGLFAINVL